MFMNRIQLLLSVGLIVFLVQAATGFTYMRTMEKNHLKALEERSEALAQSLLTDIVMMRKDTQDPRELFASLSPQCTRLYELYKSDYVASVAIIDASGSIVAHNENALVNTSVKSQEILAQLQRWEPVTVLDGQIYHTLIPIFGTKAIDSRKTVSKGLSYIVLDDNQDYKIPAIDKSKHLGTVDIGVFKKVLDQKNHQIMLYSAKRLGIMTFLALSAIGLFVFVLPFRTRMKIPLFIAIGFIIIIIEGINRLSYLKHSQGFSQTIIPFGVAQLAIIAVALLLFLFPFERR